VRIADVMRLGLSALVQQKTRTALTMLGVVIGACLLMLSLSIGQGVKQAVANEFRRHDQLRKIVVLQGTRTTPPPAALQIKGNISEAKRERLREAIERRWRGKAAPLKTRRLTRAALRELAALDHVQSAVPYLVRWGYARFGDKTEGIVSAAAGPDNLSYRQRIVAGSYIVSPSADEVVVSEYLLYRWGIVEDEAVKAVLGRMMVLEEPTLRGPPVVSPQMLLQAAQAGLTPADARVLEGAVAKLPGILAQSGLSAQEKALLGKLLGGRQGPPTPSTPVRRALKIVGVMRDPTRGERLAAWEGLMQNVDALVPAEVAENMYFAVPAHRHASFGQVTVRVDSEEHLAEVQRKIADMGFETWSLVEVAEQARFSVLVVSFATAFMALVALVVAGLGIANTMLMSVLERTHEIGVMKAVGARDGHILGMFLVEGTLIGLMGGWLGVGLGWLCSLPGEQVARSLLAKNTPLQLEGSLFVFPWWMWLGIPLFVSVLTLLSALYPAQRAARVNPITALRHE
jgi:putative ABC transport system permease protein